MTDNTNRIKTDLERRAGSLSVNIHAITQDWINLVETVQNKYQYEMGHLFDAALFRRCMKETYEYFYIENEPKDLFGKEEFFCWGMVLAYANLPIVYSALDEFNREDDEPIAFEASLKAANDFADSFFYGILSMEDYKMGAIYEHVFENKIVQERQCWYDFLTGDLEYYIRCVKEQYS